MLTTYQCEYTGDKKLRQLVTPPRAGHSEIGQGLGPAGQGGAGQGQGKLGHCPYKATLQWWKGLGPTEVGNFSKHDTQEQQQQRYQAVTSCAGRKAR